MNTLRATLHQAGNEIVGTVETNGDSLFRLECLQVIVEGIADKAGVPADEVVRDLYALVTGRVVS